MEIMSRLRTSDGLLSVKWFLIYRCPEITINLIFMISEITTITTPEFRNWKWSGILYSIFCTTLRGDQDHIRIFGARNRGQYTILFMVAMFNYSNILYLPQVNRKGGRFNPFDNIIIYFGKNLIKIHL